MISNSRLARCGRSLTNSWFRRSALRQVHIDAYHVRHPRQVHEVGEGLAKELAIQHCYDDGARIVSVVNGDVTSNVCTDSHVIVHCLENNLAQSKLDVQRVVDQEPASVSVVGYEADLLASISPSTSRQHALDPGKHSVAHKSLGISLFPPLTIVCGPMFAGKTSRLVDFYQQATGGGNQLRIAVLKPSVDDRNGATEVVTHDGRLLPPAQSYDSLDLNRDFPREPDPPNRTNPFDSNCTDPSDLTNPFDLFLIDEGHFFDPTQLQQFLVDVKEMYPCAATCVAGLDYDYMGRAFPAIEAASGISHATVDKVTSTCQYHGPCASSDNDGVVCGAQAQFTARRHGVSGDVVLVGGAESYFPICLSCFKQHQENTCGEKQ